MTTWFSAQTRTKSSMQLPTHAARTLVIIATRSPAIIRRRRKANKKAMGAAEAPQSHSESLDKHTGNNAQKCECKPSSTLPQSSSSPSSSSATPRLKVRIASHMNIRPTTHRRIGAVYDNWNVSAVSDHFFAQRPHAQLALDVVAFTEATIPRRPTSRSTQARRQGLNGLTAKPNNPHGCHHDSRRLPCLVKQTISHHTSLCPHQFDCRRRAGRLRTCNSSGLTDRKAHGDDAKCGDGGQQRGWPPCF